MENGTPRTYCIHDENLVRNHEAALATIGTSLKDFMVRYETDKRECADRYRGDRDEAREWRGVINRRFDKMETSLETFTTFMQELRPDYKRALVLWGIIILGALGIVWKMIWDRVISR
jgi:hypothetical protein